MSAPLSRVYPERVDLARRSPLLQVAAAQRIAERVRGMGRATNREARCRTAPRT